MNIAQRFLHLQVAEKAVFSFHRIVLELWTMKMYLINSFIIKFPVEL